LRYRRFVRDPAARLRVAERLLKTRPGLETDDRNVALALAGLDAAVKTKAVAGEFHSFGARHGGRRVGENTPRRRSRIKLD
jgi:hypothetical protein